MSFEVKHCKIEIAVLSRSAQVQENSKSKHQDHRDYINIPVNSTDLSSTLLISDPKNTVYWLSTWFEEIYWLATDFADLEKSSIFFSASRSVCSLQCISPDPITVVSHPYQ